MVSACPLAVVLDHAVTSVSVIHHLLFRALVLESVGYFVSRCSGSSQKKPFTVLQHVACIDPMVLNLPLLDSPMSFLSGLILDPPRFLSQFISRISHAVVIFTMTVTLPAMDDPAALRRLLGECSMASILIEHIVGMGYATIATIAHALGDPERLEDFVEHLSLVPTGESFNPFSPQTASIRRCT